MAVLPVAIDARQAQSGARAATGAIDSVTNSADKLKKSEDQATKSTDNLAKALRRAKQLAIGFVGFQALRGLTDLQSNALRASAAFEGLTKNADGAEKTLAALKRGTAGLVSEVDLMLTANNAMLLGVAKSAKEFENLTLLSRRLGAAVGRGPVESFNDMVVGVGRMSKQILDNLAINVEAERAYSTFAARIGTTAERLTDAQKKQAFLNETLAQARAKVGELGEDVDKMAGAWEQAGVAIKDALTDVVSSGVMQTIATWVSETIAGLRIIIKDMERAESATPGSGGRARAQEARNAAAQGRPIPGLNTETSIDESGRVIQRSAEETARLNERRLQLAGVRSGNRFQQPLPGLGTREDVLGEVARHRGIDLRPDDIAPDIGLEERQNAILRDRAKAVAAVNNEVKGVKPAVQELTGAFAEFAFTLEDALLDIITDFKNLRETAEELAKSITRLVLREALVRPIVGGIVGAVSGGFGGAGAGGGGQASGTVFSEPTFFASSSRRGVLGEAGPEGLLPLARDSSGRLSVRSVGSGGGVTVNMTVITPDANSFRRSNRQVVGRLQRAVTQNLR